MFYRNLFITLAMLHVLPAVAADAVAKNEKNGFVLVANSDVMYEPWPDAPQFQARKPIVPPPPGPYISSALSNLTPAFTSNSAADVKLDSDKGGRDGINTAPLLKPNIEWSSKQPKPEIWVPEGGFKYAPSMAQDRANNARPPVFMNHPRRFNDRVYGYGQPVYGYGQPAYGYGHPAYGMPPRYNMPPYAQPRPMWDNFAIPPSNYNPYGQQPTGAAEPVAEPAPAQP